MTRQKLQSENGATLTVALVFFVICAAVGAVFLTAASSAVGSISQKQALDQRYYAVNSAAELLRDRIAGCSVTGTFTFTDGKLTGYEFAYEPNGSGVSTENSMIASFLMALVEKQYALEEGDKAEGAGPVSVRVTFPGSVLTDGTEAYELSAAALLEMKEADGAADSASGAEALSGCYGHEFDLYVLLSSLESASDTVDFADMASDADRYYAQLTMNSAVTLTSAVSSTDENGALVRTYVLTIVWPDGTIKEAVSDGETTAETTEETTAAE